MRDCSFVNESHLGRRDNKAVLLILMYAHKIKPVVLLHARLEELDLAVSERPKEPFIPHIAHAIKRKFCMSLL